MKDEVGEEGGRETRGTQDAICGGPPRGCVLALSALSSLQTRMFSLLLGGGWASSPIFTRLGDGRFLLWHVPPLLSPAFEDKSQRGQSAARLWLISSHTGRSPLLYHQEPVYHLRGALIVYGSQACSHCPPVIRQVESR